MRRTNTQPLIWKPNKRIIITIAGMITTIIDD